MTNPTINGYAQDPYLETPYAGGTVKDYYAVQSNFIINRQKALAARAKIFINASDSNGIQVNHIIAGYPKAIAEQILLNIIKEKQIAIQIQNEISKSNDIGSQIEQIIVKDYAIGFQVSFKTKVETINGIQTTLVMPDTCQYIGTQVEHSISKQKPIAIETKVLIDDKTHSNGIQSKSIVQEKKHLLGSQSCIVINSFDEFGLETSQIIHKEYSEAIQSSRSIIEYPESFGIEFRMSKSFPHQKCIERGYLEESYLDQRYLVAGNCVSGPIEVELHLNKQHPSGIQVKNTVKTWLEVSNQVRHVIANHLHSSAIQFQLYRAFKLGIQFRAVLYNATNLRCLYNFPSRGNDGINWTASSTASGDFSANNLNTDIVEQRWQSATGFKTVTLVCDTQVVQGVTIDTLAILNHNLTTAASIALEGSNDASFNTINDTIMLAVKKYKQDIFYIAPTMPTIQSRYYRFTITDNNNPENNIKIGTIVFGNSIILQGENFTDVVRRKKTHFVDSIRTEGYTSVSNDRALKRGFTIDFENIAYDKGNYNNLQTIFDNARTSLKCLWIPDPKYPERFGIFGKLAAIPDEEHKNMGDGADTVNFSIEVDEAL